MQQFQVKIFNYKDGDMLYFYLTDLVLSYKRGDDRFIVHSPYKDKYKYDSSLDIEDNILKLCRLLEIPEYITNIATIAYNYFKMA